MNLLDEEAKLFYDLYPALLAFVNRKLAVSPEQFTNAEEFVRASPEARVAIRDALFAQRELIDEFVQDNPANLTAEDLEIVRSWKHALVGRFYVFRYLKSFTVFLSTGDPQPKAYGVLGLVDSFEHGLGLTLPRLVNAVLLPFRGRITYDGLLTGYNIMFGGGIKRRLNEEYKDAKAAFGIITCLGAEPPAVALPEKAQPKPRKTQKPSTAPSSAAQAKAIAGTLNEMTDDFCREHLNDDYAELCRELTAALARKRPSPLLRGKLATWASGIVRTIGWVNFLHDPSQTPHMKLYAIDEAFGVAESTGAAKLGEIRKMLKIYQLDPKWTLRSRLDDNPMVWMVSINGFILDVRSEPREIQAEAYRKGLIPYIPADRQEHAP